jgi:putative membrane protein
MRREIRRTVPQATAVVLVGTVLVLGACKKGDNSNGAADTTAMARPDSSMPAGATPANSTATTSGAMTDAQIFARLAAANEGEIAAGKLAESKATNADVKAFARMMVTDHTKLLNDGNALAKRLNITPDTTAAMSMQSDNATMASQLNAAPKGMTFDTTYVNGQAAGHQAVLQMIKTAETQAQSADLKKALNSAEPVVQHHLDRIQSIQGKLK